MLHTRFVAKGIVENLSSVVVLSKSEAHTQMIYRDQRHAILFDSRSTARAERAVLPAAGTLLLLLLSKKVYTYIFQLFMIRLLVLQTG